MSEWRTDGKSASKFLRFVSRLSFVRFIAAILSADFKLTGKVSIV